MEFDECWKPVKNYEGLYEVSNIGRIRSIPRKTTSGKILTPQRDKYGYYRICLSKNNKHVLKQVHRLVAESFIDNPSNHPQVNHIDECKNNNKVSNLEWCSSHYNDNYGTRNKRLSVSQSYDILQLDLDGKVIKHWKGINNASRCLNINHANIISCCKGVRKTAGGYKWRYVDGIR